MLDRTRYHSVHSLIRGLLYTLFILNSHLLYSQASDTSGIDIHYLKLEMHVSDTTSFLRGKATWHFETTSSIKGLLFELVDTLAIDSVSVDNVSWTWKHEHNLVVLNETDLAASTLHKVTIAYHGDAGGFGFFSGISSKADPVWHVPVTWTLSEPYDANSWFPVKQVLTDKIDSSDFYFTVAKGLRVGSNGRLVSVDTLPGGYVTFHWKSSYPIAYYLISMTVAAYQDYTIYAHPQGMQDPLPVQNYIYSIPEVLALNKQNIDTTTYLIELFSSLFGGYPFPKEKYGHCMAPMGGGMEHQTMTTLNDFGFPLVAHELTHMWFGDMVTCATWSDIWLNEGFASYGEYLACEYLGSRKLADEWMVRAHYEAFAAPSGSVYIPEAELANKSRIFNSSLSYKKGASIVHMLRYEIGNDSLFFRILRTYLQRYKYRTATTEEFEKVVEELTGKDFSGFFNQWCYGEGYPSLTVSWAQNKGKLHFEILQKSSSEATPLFVFPLQVKVLFASGDTLITLPITDCSISFDLPVRSRVMGIVADPSGYLLMKALVYEMDDSGKYMHVFPNPSSHHLYIKFSGEQQVRNIHIINMAGQVIQDFSSADDYLTIDVRRWASGMYIILVEDKNAKYSAKVLRQ